MKKTIKYFIPVIITMAGIFYYFADPQKTVVMPKCPMRMLTGWQCPSCGAQRALHELLHGNLIRAISYNFFFIIAVPFLCVTVYAIYMKQKDSQSTMLVKLYNFVTSRYTLMAYLFAFLLWWIVRNIIGC